MLSRLRTRVRETLADRVVPVMPGLLRTVAEAGWLTVLYAAASVIADKQAPVIGPIEMYLFVGAGVVIGAVGRRNTAIGALLLIGAVVVAGALGSLAGQDLFAITDWQRALGAHFAGWLTGLALLRGAVITIGEKAAASLEQMLRVVPIFLAVVWAYTSFVARPELWLPFAVAGMWGTGMYLSGSIVGIGLARLRVLHAEVEDQRQRRAWRWLVIGVGFAIVPLSIPVAILAGIPLTQLISPLVGPLQWLLSLLAYPLAFIIWIASILLRPIAEPLGQLLDEIEQRVILVPDQATESPALATALAGLIALLTLILIALVIFFAARWLLQRRHAPDGDPEPGFADIERAIVMPAAEPPRPRGRVRRLGPPRDAVGAYLSTMAELDAYGELARQPAETPAAHASRLRSFDQVRWPDLARLAATYQLARYGDRSISRVENARAISRFRRLRRALRVGRGPR
jgi:MFS family permease